MRQKYGAAEIVDPVPAAIGSLQRIFEGYNHLGRVVPAMCYSNTQIWDLCRPPPTAEAVGFPSVGILRFAVHHLGLRLESAGEVVQVDCWLGQPAGTPIPT